MNTVNIGNYREHNLYPKVVWASARLLMETDEISPVTILVQMGNLTPKDVESWRRGNVPYLERVFQGSLSKANRILRLIGFHAHDLNMVPTQHVYRQRGSNKRLRFSKSGTVGIEARYSRHFRWNQSSGKKLKLIEKTMSEPVTGHDAQS